MGQSPEELRRDIEETRAELGGTLDAIGDRVSPGRIIERRTNRARQGVQRVRERVMGAAHDAGATSKEQLSATVDTVREAPQAAREGTQGSPLVAGGLAFGIGFLIASIAPRTRTESQAVSAIGDHIQPLKEELAGAGQHVVENLKEPTREAASNVKEAAAAGGREVADQARSGVQDTAETARGAADDLRS